MKRFFLMAILLIASMTLFTGCNKTNSTSNTEMQTLSYDGHDYQVPKQPQGIIVLSNSILQMLYAVDGKAIARVESSESLPTELESVQSVGHTANPSMETILSLHPDLVLGLSNQHSKLASTFESNKIPFIPMNFEGLDSTVPILTLLGQITGHEDKAQEVIKQYNNRIQAVKEKAAQHTPARVAVLRATGKSVTAETTQAITASMVKELGMTNVTIDPKEKTPSSKTIPYSLEALTQANPDIIFIVTMGKEADIQKTMKSAMIDNPAWKDLKAVQTGKVIYLPSNLFLLNPGLNTPDAMEKLINYAYGQ